MKKVNTRLEQALTQVEAKFFIQDKKFPYPTQRDMTANYWDKLKPIIRDILKKFI